MTEYTRKTITVPSRLARQMSNTSGVNWSQVASRAFEMELAQSASEEEANTMESVVGRLRKSKEEGENTPYSKGIKGGRSWAMDYASFHELKRASTVDPNGVELYLSDRWDGKPRAVQLMFWTLGPDHPFNCVDVETMSRAGLKSLQDANPTSWDPVRDKLFAHRGQKELFDDRSFVRGLIEGAKQVWESVRHEI